MLKSKESKKHIRIHIFGETFINNNLKNSAMPFTLSFWK